MICFSEMIFFFSEIIFFFVHTNILYIILNFILHITLKIEFSSILVFVWFENNNRKKNNKYLRETNLEMKSH